MAEPIHEKHILPKINIKRNILDKTVRIKIHNAIKYPHR